MKITKRKMVLFLVICFFCVTWCALHATPVHAQQITLSLDPPIIETLIKPGKSILVAYTVENGGDPTPLQFRIRPFAPLGEQGSVKVEETFSGPIVFLLENTDIQLEKAFFFPSRGKQQAVVRITVPEGLPEGDYYYMIMAETVPALSVGGQSTGIASASVGSPLIMSVTETGVTEANGHIDSFFITPLYELHWGNKKIQFVESSSSIPLTCIVANEGKHTIKPEGTISVRSGSTIHTHTLVPQNVLSGSKRVVKTSLSSNSAPDITMQLSGFRMGKNVVSTSLTFGLNSQTALAQTEFYAVPFRFIGIMLLLLFFTTIFFAVVKKGRT